MPIWLNRNIAPFIGAASVDFIHGSLTSFMVLRLSPGMLHYGYEIPFFTHPHEPHTDWLKPISTRAPKKKESFLVMLSYYLVSCICHATHIQNHLLYTL